MQLRIYFLHDAMSAITVDRPPTLIAQPLPTPEHGSGSRLRTFEGRQELLDAAFLRPKAVQLGEGGAYLVLDGLDMGADLLQPRTQVLLP